MRHFYDLVQRIIYPANGYGRLGGKSAGLFLAQRIFSKPGEHSPVLSDLKFPKTWYITTDAIMSFLSYNNLEEVNEQKYKEIDQIRLEYQNVIQLMKNAHFPVEIVKGLSMALDDLGDKPLIVRSSSLLEDRMGTAFSGKYKSLFLANQGSKQERLEALTDAIAEVYASIFGPDPIEYRAERGLLDFHEEMGIMIQEVVGQRVGD
ncbi:MAG: PEP/pyruvate-binding domain-containing protein, partial [Acidobacteria bacterium]|nr:PEP/pyruvate-binding domain-containing protein [Acidobacteriota bacterium]